MPVNQMRTYSANGQSVGLNDQPVIVWERSGRTLSYADRTLSGARHAAVSDAFSCSFCMQENGKSYLHFTPCKILCQIIHFASRRILSAK